MFIKGGTSRKLRSKVICASLLVMIAIIPAITISASATTTIANTSVTLSQSAYYPWSYYCSRNDIIRVSFDVTSGGYTTFLIMSQYDYVLFVSSVPTYGYEVLYRYSYGEIFVWVAPTADTYYFVSIIRIRIQLARYRSQLLTIQAQPPPGVTRSCLPLSVL